MREQEGAKATVHTFCIGIKGSPDLIAARQVANHIQSEHHEFHMTVEEGIDALSEIVYFLESYQQVLHSSFSKLSHWQYTLDCYSDSV